ncbi:MAG: putative DNA modification/repair radical SAM protein [Clostridia bacterium]|nr:putative DNA modification/repair radical SAM protein [Clostridia bacterium]
MIEEWKLKILAESAKYDVSCSSSGSSRANIGTGIGNAAPWGICHSFTPDGRCVSLLKILLSNDCIYDCEYCPNKRSADVPRATATPEEICELTIAFYKRNYIEGLFLSSAVWETPDKTMEQLCLTAEKLRNEYGFHGYIHIKGIPHASEALIDRAARVADRMSYNMELPTEKSLKLLCPQKTKESLLLPMRHLKDDITYEKENKLKRTMIPAGQTTQIIVGASPEPDGVILNLTESLYRKMNMKRVYYSSYIPVVQSDLLPTKGAGLLREHRLYQADWLIRFYGFDVNEICAPGENLSEDYDPKCAWALRHMELFPVEVNRAPLEMLLRVPGIGAKSAYRIINARKYGAIDFDQLTKMRVVMKRAKHFITCKGKFIGDESLAKIRNSLLLGDAPQTEEPNEQLSMFSTPELSLSALTGDM